MFSSSGCNSLIPGCSRQTDRFILHIVIFSTFKHLLDNECSRNQSVGVILDTYEIFLWLKEVNNNSTYVIDCDKDSKKEYLSALRIVPGTILSADCLIERKSKREGWGNRAEESVPKQEWSKRRRERKEEGEREGGRRKAWDTERVEGKKERREE